MEWPPDLDDLKRDLRRTDDRDDVSLTDQLDAALAFVRDVHGARWNLDDDPFSPLPAPDALLALGTVRLAARWHARGRSPDGMIQSGDLGAARVTSFDTDIDRQLRIGRHAPPVFA